VLPVDTPEDVERTLKSVLADPKINVTVMTPAVAAKFVPMNPKVLSAVAAATTKNWPGMSVVPYMGTGATDGRFLNNVGIPTYGVSGIFVDEDDIRAHGRDERILVRSFDEGVDFMYTVSYRLHYSGERRLRLPC
jgi:acetylornithine deacetylase/succinyl-diaminopimelate desuccinylase-like protein